MKAKEGDERELRVEVSVGVVDVLCGEKGERTAAVTKDPDVG